MKNRREFLSDALKVAAGISAASVIQSPASAIAKSLFAESAELNATGFEFSQVKLPYSYAALEPYIDAATMEIHYTKHHSAYVKNVNEAIKSENLNYSNAVQFFENASKISAKARNNGGGAWNHNMFWQVMHPAASSAPGKNLSDALSKQFGSFENFREQFTQAAMGRFGSGWAWLVKDTSGNLKIGSTPNQDNPLMDVSEFRGTPLLCLDVWEHAYYLKYQNKRNDYINAWWKLVNWNEVTSRYNS